MAKHGSEPCPNICALRFARAGEGAKMYAGKPAKLLDTLEDDDELAAALAADLHGRKYHCFVQLTPWR